MTKHHYRADVINTALVAFDEMLERMEDDGWEFVTWLPASAEDSVLVILRRPK